MMLKTRRSIGTVLAMVLGLAHLAGSASALPQCGTWIKQDKASDSVCMAAGSNCMDGTFGTGHDYLYNEEVITDTYSNGVQYACVGPNIVPNKCCTFSGTPNCPSAEDNDTCVTS